MRALKFFGLTLGVAVVGLFIYAAWFLYGPVIRNVIWPRRYYYTISADLSIGDERIAMSGTTECRWVQMPRPLPLTTDVSHYQMIGGPVVKRLADGSALLIWVGNLCGGGRNADGVLFDEDQDVAVTAHGALVLATEGHWYLAHLDDAETPKHITVYIGPQYFRLPQAEVRLRHIEIRTEPSGHGADASAEVPWLQSDRSRLSIKGTPFLGYYARVVSRDVWEHNVDLARILSATKTPIPNVHERLREAGLENISVDLSSMGDVTGAMDDGQYLSFKTKESNEKWSLVLTPQPTPSTDTEQCYGAFFPWLRSTSSRKLVIDGRPFSKNLGQAEMIFDPASGSLFNIGSLCISPTQSFVSTD